MSMEAFKSSNIFLGIWKATCVHRPVFVPRNDEDVKALTLGRVKALISRNGRLREGCKLLV